MSDDAAAPSAMIPKPSVSSVTHTVVPSLFAITHSEAELDVAVNAKPFVKVRQLQGRRIWSRHHPSQGPRLQHPSTQLLSTSEHLSLCLLHPKTMRPRSYHLQKAHQPSTARQHHPEKRLPQQRSRVVAPAFHLL